MHDDAAELTLLLARIRAGDPAAEDEFVVRFSGTIRQFLSHEVADRDDLSQEIFLALLVRLRRQALRNPEAVGAFVRRVATYKLWQERKRRRMYAERFTAEADEVADRSADTLATLLEAERRAQLHTALLELPNERDRDVLRRIYLRGESPSVVMAAHEITQEHLHRVLHRARIRLRRLLNQKARSG